MAARIDNGRAQLLTRTGLDWTDKYPSAIAALADVRLKAAISTANSAESTTPVAKLRPDAGGDRWRSGVHLISLYAFDLLHINGWDVSGLELIERKLLEPPVKDKPGLQLWL